MTLTPAMCNGGREETREREREGEVIEMSQRKSRVWQGTREKS